MSEDRRSFVDRHPIATTTVACSAAFGIFAGLLTAYKSYDYVPTGSYGVRDFLGQVEPDILPPGIHAKKAWRESITSFNNNVVRREFSAGSSNDIVTKDRNPFAANFRVHYTITPAAGLLSLHMADMSNDDGISLVTDIADNALRSIAGQQDMTTLMNNPDTFLKAFGPEFSRRLAMFNVPVKVEMLELLSTDVGGWRKIVQMRLLSDGKIEVPVTGPAVLPVPLDMTERPPTVAAPSALPAAAPKP